MKRKHDYSAAIDTLTRALEILDNPRAGIGYDWGLQRGSAGWFVAVRARDQLRGLRDSFQRYHDLGIDPTINNPDLARRENELRFGPIGRQGVGAPFHNDDEISA